jgi:hypothetical protein
LVFLGRAAFVYDLFEGLFDVTVLDVVVKQFVNIISDTNDVCEFSVHHKVQNLEYFLLRGIRKASFI